MVECSLAVVRIGFELSRPDVEPFLGWVTLECADVGEWHVGPDGAHRSTGRQRADLRVVAIPRSRVHRGRGEEALDRICPEPFGREARAFREFSCGHEIVHKMKLGPCPMVRVKWDDPGTAEVPRNAGRVTPVAPRDWSAEVPLLPEGVAHQANRDVCDEQQRDEHSRSKGGRRQGTYCRPHGWRGGTVVDSNRLSLPDAVLNRAGYCDAHASDYDQHDD